MSSIRPELRWFLHLACERNLLTPAEARSLAKALGNSAHLLEYAEEMLGRGFYHDLGSVQDLASEADELTRAGVPPPTQLLSAPDAPQPVAVHVPGLAPLPSTFFPSLEETRQWLLQVLQAARDNHAADLHLSAGAPPCWRRAGRLEAIGDEVLSADMALLLNIALLDKGQQRDFQLNHDFSEAIELPGGDRCRLNVVHHHGGTSGTFHLVPAAVPTLADLGLVNHQAIERQLDSRNGLILVAGPAGCGKTTTLAALVATLNRNRYAHIITVEDPIEIVHPPGTCFITQRQVAVHTRNYATALRAALREDPDVIVIGDMRDLETVEMAVTAAETGHLVLGSLHTSDAATTLNRVLAVFPPIQQSHIRSMLAESLRCILCQRLLPTAAGDGLALAAELLINTPAVANLIRDGRSHQLDGIMQTSVQQGMQTLDRDLIRLFQEGTLAYEEVTENLKSREMLEKLRKMRRLMQMVHNTTGDEGSQDEASASPKGRKYLQSTEL